MSDILIIIVSAISLVNLILLLQLLGNSGASKLIKLDGRFDSMEKSQERSERTILSQLVEISSIQQNQLDIFSKQLTALTQSNENKLEKMREVIEERIKHLQEDNNQKLEQMRVTVDEKLSSTLEQRLGDSFKLVSERLELVHRGLGEMQSLAAGVGDLKKVLTNVKARGTWGEIQLEALLDQVLTSEQYCKNVATRKNSNDRVEFALKLPGRSDMTETVWLPIDSKFPQEDYIRLLDAQEQSNPAAFEEASKSLEARIKGFARDIRDKYLDPPNTTDFAIMFLPTEGLYAEFLRRPGVCEYLQNECRIVVAGPTTLIALLNSLQMGFRTLAIEKRTSEVWSLLGAVKTEFSRFGDMLDKTQKKLLEASNTIENAARKSRTIERKLKNVQELSINQAAAMLESTEDEE